MTIFSFAAGEVFVSHVLMNQTRVRTRSCPNPTQQVPQRGSLVLRRVTHHGRRAATRQSVLTASLVQKHVGLVVIARYLKLWPFLVRACLVCQKKAECKPACSVARQTIEPLSTAVMFC